MLQRLPAMARPFLQNLIDLVHGVHEAVLLWAGLVARQGTAPGCVPLPCTLWRLAARACLPAHPPACIPTPPPAACPHLLACRPLPIRPGGVPRTEGSLLIHLDPHIPFIPAFLLNFVLGVLAP